MSLSSVEISTIQQAGVALHRATQTVSAALRTQAQSLIDRFSSQPLHADSEQAFAQFRQLAGLSQELAGMEDKLKNLYSNVAQQRRTGKSATASNASAARAKGAHAGASRAAKKALKPAKTHSKTLSGNDLKVLGYLQGILKTTEWTPLTGAVVAAGSGLPKGSVGISLTRVVASGAVRRGEGGTYQLAAAPDATR